MVLHRLCLTRRVCLHRCWLLLLLLRLMLLHVLWLWMILRLRNTIDRWRLHSWYWLQLRVMWLQVLLHGLWQRLLRRLRMIDTGQCCVGRTQQSAAVLKSVRVKLFHFDQMWHDVPGTPGDRTDEKRKAETKAKKTSCSTIVDEDTAKMTRVRWVRSKSRSARWKAQRRMNTEQRESRKVTEETLYVTGVGPGANTQSTTIFGLRNVNQKWKTTRTKRIMLFVNVLCWLNQVESIDQVEFLHKVWVVGREKSDRPDDRHVVQQWWDLGEFGGESWSNKPMTGSWMRKGTSEKVRERERKRKIRMRMRMNEWRWELFEKSVDIKCDLKKSQRSSERSSSNCSNISNCAPNKSAPTAPNVGCYSRSKRRSYFEKGVRKKEEDAVNKVNEETDLSNLAPITFSRAGSVALVSSHHLLRRQSIVRMIRKRVTFDLTWSFSIFCLSIDQRAKEREWTILKLWNVWIDLVMVMKQRKT